MSNTDDTLARARALGFGMTPATIGSAGGGFSQAQATARPVTIILDKETAALLSDALSNYTDVGPPGEGWASDELKKLRSIVGSAIENS